MSPPPAILLPVSIVCLGDDVGQPDEKEVYFYLGYIIDCKLLPTRVHAHAHARRAIRRYFLHVEIGAVWRVLVSGNADFGTTRLLLGWGGP